MRISDFSLIFTMTLLDGSVWSKQTTCCNGTLFLWPLQTGFTTRDITSARVRGMERDFSFRNCPPWLLGPPCFLFNGHWVPFLGLKWPERKMTTHLLLVPRLRMELYVYYSICCHGVDREHFNLPCGCVTTDSMRHYSHVT